jgi:hypothetical protein
MWEMIWVSDGVGVLPNWAVCPYLVWTLLVYNWPWLYVDIVLHVPHPCTIEVGYEFLMKLRLVLQTGNCQKIQCDCFYVSVFPMVSKFCATITKITDFTDCGTQN